jgi:peptide/nickel transport system substrate-binding protein
LSLTRSRIRVPLVLLGLATALIAAGCGGSSGSGGSGKTVQDTASFYTGWPTQGTPKHGGTLTVDVTEAPKTFDPAKLYTGRAAAMAVYGSLFEAMPTTANQPPVVKPVLVSSWSASPDRRTYTFHLKEGLEFSNGQPLIAEDVAFSLQLETHPPAVGGVLMPNLEHAVAVGKSTVRVELKKPESPAVFTELLADTLAFPIIPEHLYRSEGGTKFGQKPVGMGPFILSNATSGNATTTYVPNPHYLHAGQPYLEKLVINQVESDNARILAVRSGGAQIAQEIPYAQVPALKGTPGVKVLIGPLWGSSFVVYNRNKAPYNDVNVRKALMYATPREQILKSVYKGIGTVPNTLFGGEKYVDPTVPSYPYDIAKAKELLMHSSVPHGFNMVMNTVSGETQGELLASILQSSYAQIGVHVAIQPQPITTLFSNGEETGKFEVQVDPPELGYSSFYVPDANTNYYIDNTIEQPEWQPKAKPKVLAELAAARESGNEAEREKLFKEIQYQTYYEEAFFIPIVNLVTLNLASNNVRGFQVMPSILMHWNEVWLTS